MEKSAIIKNLLEIKKSIIEGAHGGVTDTAWMVDSMNETICDRLDQMILDLGLSADELEILEHDWREPVNDDDTVCSIEDPHCDFCSDTNQGEKSEHHKIHVKKEEP